MLHKFRNELRTCASELMRTNVETANALYTEFKPATYNVVYLDTRLNHFFARFFLLLRNSRGLDIVETSTDGLNRTLATQFEAAELQK